MNKSYQSSKSIDYLLIAKGFAEPPITCVRMASLALVPGIIAAIVAFLRSPQQALLNVYLPVLLMVPEYYRWTVPLLPKLTPSHSAIMGIIVIAVVRKKLKWRFSLTDALVIAMVVGISISEYTNTGYKEAQNLTFDMLAWLLFPYLATKIFVEPLGLRVIFARRIAILMFAVSMVSLYEFRLGRTLFRVPFDPFFAGQGSGWVTTFRWGFARIAGPYGHAILAGVVMIIGYRIQKWLEWGGHWERSFKRFPGLPWSKAKIISYGIIAGSVMTMCRGPWMGGGVAALVIGVGRSRNRKLAIRIALAGLLLIGVPAAVSFYSYISVGRAHATSVSQETAAYRKELMDKYTDIAMEHSVLGWGRNTWPKVAGMESIDNYYLQLTLMHGVTATSLLLAIIVTMMVRLGRRGARSGYRTDEANLAFTLLSCYAAIAFSIATVYMGNQLLPLFAVLTGWSEGFLTAPARQTVKAGAATAPLMPLRFQRVVT